MYVAQKVQDLEAGMWHSIQHFTPEGRQVGTCTPCMQSTIVLLHNTALLKLKCCLENARLSYRLHQLIATKYVVCGHEWLQAWRALTRMIKHPQPKQRTMPSFGEEVCGVCIHGTLHHTERRQLV